MVVVKNIIKFIIITIVKYIILNTLNIQFFKIFRSLYIINVLILLIFIH